jgi:hypothetical protein
VRYVSTLVFSVLLVFHVLACMTCVVPGAVAELESEAVRSPSCLGVVYFWALAIVFVTSTVMALLRWSEDAFLFVLGILAFSLALFGIAARRQPWRGWITAHILGISGHSGAAIWALDDRATRNEYGFRALHVVSIAAKAITHAFCGVGPTHTYFNGCSDGGREAMG